MAEKKPFDLTARYQEIRKEPFRFDWDGRTWTLPYVLDADLRVIAAAETGDLDKMREALALAFEESGQAEAWLQTPQPASAIMELFTAWQEHDGVAPGESGASSPSSTSTGRPSKRTSPGSTGSGSARRSRAKTETVELPGNS